MSPLFSRKKKGSAPDPGSAPSPATPAKASASATESAAESAPPAQSATDVATDAATDVATDATTGHGDGNTGRGQGADAAASVSAASADDPPAGFTTDFSADDGAADDGAAGASGTSDAPGGAGDADDAAGAPAPEAEDGAEEEKPRATSKAMDAMDRAKNFMRARSRTRAGAESAGSGQAAAADSPQSAPEGGQDGVGPQNNSREAADNQEENHEASSAIDPDSAPAPPEGEAPASVSQAVDGWLAHLRDVGGKSPLEDMTLMEGALINLSAAHPSGLAHLYAGRPVRISSLIRQDHALVRARRESAAMLARVKELLAEHGSAPVFLAVGEAHWDTWGPTETPDSSDDAAPTSGDASGGQSAHEDEPAQTDERADGPRHSAHSDPAAILQAPPTRRMRAPVLLRSISLTDQRGELTLQLSPGAQVNEVIRQVMETGARETLDRAVRESVVGTAFTPQHVLDVLAELAPERLANFELKESVTVGPLIHPAAVLIDDADRLRPTFEASAVVNALAGNPAARRHLLRPLPKTEEQDREPSAERGAGDLDVTELGIVETIASGRDIFIDAPAGSQPVRTVASTAADAAASGRSVLIISGAPRASDAVVEQLASLGLSELTLDFSADGGEREMARQLRAGLRMQPVRVNDDATLEIRGKLHALRTRMSAYIRGLHTIDRGWGISAYQAITGLADLTARRPAPATRVRLSERTLSELGSQQAPEIRRALVGLLALSQKSQKVDHSAWNGALIHSDEQATEALELAGQLEGIDLPEMETHARTTAARTGLAAATTIEQWGEQLQMLDGIAESLDIFLPQVFERSAADMVAATATKRWREEHGVQVRSSQRRSLVKQARDMVRPGVRVDDLHAALIEVQVQRELWRRQCPDGGWPVLPEGLEQMKHTYSQARQRVERLDRFFTEAPSRRKPPAGKEAPAPRQPFVQRPFGALRTHLRELSGQPEELRMIPERREYVRKLKEVGLWDLARDLLARRVPPQQVDNELELAREISILDALMRSKPALSQVRPGDLAQMAQQLRELDAAHIATLHGPIMRAVVSRLRSLEHADKEGTIALDQALEKGQIALRELMSEHAALVRAARPIHLIPPTLAARDLPHLAYDLVIILSADTADTATLLPALGRARQVVAVGDARRAASAYGRNRDHGALAAVLPGLRLPTVRSSLPEAISTALQEDYPDLVTIIPDGPRSHRPTFHLVEDGVGVPAHGSQIVQAPVAEVDTVIELALQHARQRPDQTLGIVAGNAYHRAALAKALTNRFVLADTEPVAGKQPIVVTDFAGASWLKRDRIILTIGIGRTPHGRLLLRFEELTGPEGPGLVAGAVGAAREQLDIVACFNAADIDPRHIPQRGPQLLAGLMAWAQQSDDAPATADAQRLAVSRSGEGFALREANAVPAGAQNIASDDAASASSAGEVADAGTGEIADTSPKTGRGVLHDNEQLMADLIARLQARRAVVRRGPRGSRIAFTVAHPQRPDFPEVALLADDREYVTEPSLRRRDRHRLEVLEERGWKVRRLFSASVFMDPDGEADAIMAMLGIAPLRGRHPGGPAGGDRAGGAPSTTGQTQPGGQAAVSQANTPASASGSSSGSPAAPGENLPPGWAGTTSEIPAVPIRRGEIRERGPRPQVVAGQPLRAYGDDELDELTRWIDSDGKDRSDAEIKAELRSELGITRRGVAIDVILTNVVSRYRSSQGQASHGDAPQESTPGEDSPAGSAAGDEQ